MIITAGTYTVSCRKKESPLIMGVLNITPDSFSDGAVYIKPECAYRRACEMVEEGAHIIDMGAESTRPGSLPVPAALQHARLLPVLKRLIRKRIPVPISIDTMNAEVAHACLDHGAAIINDVSALSDPRMGRVVAHYRAGIVLMHMRGTPQTMQSCAQYRSVLREVKDELQSALVRAHEAGIPRSCIMLDPGIGFAKKLEHNITLIRHIDAFHVFKRPLVLGVSRKSFIGTILNREVHERTWGTLAAIAYGAHAGVQIMRVHDVKAAHDFFTMMSVLTTGKYKRVDKQRRG